ncbi:MAG: DUF721 domain-containing protein [Thermotogae bacterium]|nr:DUF721 domain-containing protein [Thermotogota bacterium]
MKMDEILKDLAKKNETLNEIYVRTILKDWKEFVGESIAEHIFPKRLESGILYLIYDDPIFANEIRMRSDEILDLLNERLEGISKIERIKLIRRGG